ncbi:MAG: 2-C-methyl-D-erythritol 4-phosphate cytidylyltransferase [Candidatus Acetothermia bacterium]
MSTEEPFAVVILAAGEGSRLGAEVNKVYLDLAGKPLLVHSMTKLSHHPRVQEMVLVINEKDRSILKRRVLDEFTFPVPLTVALGGDHRQDSSLSGLRKVESEYVLIHDGARPNFSSDLISRLIRGVVRHQASFPGVRPVDTLRRTRNQRGIETLDRNQVVQVQTPQGFRTDSIREVLEEAVAQQNYLTDDAAALMTYSGVRPYVVEGQRENIKVTRRADLELLRVLMGEVSD